MMIVTGECVVRSVCAIVFDGYTRIVNVACRECLALRVGS